MTQLTDTILMIRPAAFHYNPETGVRTAGAGPLGFYNSQDGTHLLPSVDRHTVFGTFDHKLNPTIAFFSEFSYYDSQTFGQIDASPISLATDGVTIPKGDRIGVAIGAQVGRYPLGISGNGYLAAPSGGVTEIELGAGTYVERPRLPDLRPAVDCCGAKPAAGGAR